MRDLGGEKSRRWLSAIPARSKGTRGREGELNSDRYVKKIVCVTQTRGENKR